MNLSFHIYKAYKMVWMFRDRYSEYFPTPDPTNSLRYAYSEMGEAFDAVIRSNREDNRATEKSLNYERELAQCAMMLLTATEHPEFFSVMSSALPSINDAHIGMYVAESLFFHDLREFPKHHRSLQRALECIAYTIDLPKVLHDVLRDIYILRISPIYADEDEEECRQFWHQMEDLVIL